MASVETAADLARKSAASSSGWSSTAAAYVSSMAQIPNTASAEATAFLQPEVPIGGRPIVLLDVAAGPGTFAEQAISRMKAAGVGGRVLVTDFAPGMIEAARTKFGGMAADGSLPNGITVECAVVDGQDLSPLETSGVAGSVSAAVSADGEAVTAKTSTTSPATGGFVSHLACMLGIMFMPNRAKALTEMRRMLIPGGRALIGTWLAAGPAIAFPAFVRDQGWLAPDQPAPTEATARIGRDPDELMQELLDAGFKTVEVHRGSVIRMRFEDGGAQILTLMMANPAVKPLFDLAPPGTDVHEAWKHWLSPGQPGHAQYVDGDGKVVMDWVANLALCTA